MKATVRHIICPSLGLLFLNVCFGHVCAQNVVDGGFENPRVNGFAYSPTGSAFTFVGGADRTGQGAAGIAAAGSLFTAANPGDSSQVAFLQSAGGRFYQDIDIRCPGDYVVTFIAAQRGSGSSSHHGSDHQDFNVLINGVVVAYFQPSSIDYTTYTTRPFAVDQPEFLELEFQGVDTLGDDEAVFIDNVSIASAPNHRRQPL